MSISLISPKIMMHSRSSAVAFARAGPLRSLLVRATKPSCFSSSSSAVSCSWGRAFATTTTREIPKVKKVDYYYGHEKKEEEEENKPKEKGAKLAGIRGSNLTPRWFKQVSVGKAIIPPPSKPRVRSLSSFEFTVRYVLESYKGQKDGQWAPLLDNRLVLTPLEHPMVVPSEQLALIVAAEWEMQKKFIRPDTMPVVRYHSFTQPTPPPSRAVIIDNTLFDCSEICVTIEDALGNDDHRQT